MKTFGWVCIGLGILAYLFIALIPIIASVEHTLPTIAKAVIAGTICLSYGIRTVKQEGKKDATSKKPNRP